jgi:hypothetical protein
VIWQHFLAFLWLRWRLLINQMRRAGTTNAVILGILAAGGVLLSIGLFIAFFFTGLFAFTRASATTLLLVWDGVTVGFLFFWGLGVINELQRSEVLSLDKFMHLPVSLFGAFTINYASSLFSLTLLLFAPALLGLSLGLVFSRGPLVLLVLPLLAAFLLMVTALTHQFRGWLASLMVNKRRRRTIIFLLTATLLLLSQLPNLFNLLRPWSPQPNDRFQRMLEEQAHLRQSLGERKITVQEFNKRIAEVQRAYDEQTKKESAESWQQVERMSGLLNLVLPPGWLPLGAVGAAEGNPVPALLGTLGMTLLGAASLWRSYRTTLRFYRGEFTAGKKKAVAAVPPPAPGTTAAKPAFLLEKRLPWLSEHASVITLASFRALTRAPEAKMMLLTPVFLAIAFVAMFLRQTFDVPEEVRPLFAFGAMTLILLSMVQLVGNQFGFDRNGFRVFVLCAAQRRDILLGKNLAFAPPALGMGAAVIGLMQVLKPMRLDHLVAVVPQMVAMYLVFCLMANLLSILAPIPVAAGAMRVSNIKGVPLLLHILFAFLFPAALLPLMLPLGIEPLLAWLGWLSGVPLCLILSVLECAAVVPLYRLVLGWEGMLLQARELHILETVITRAE